MFSAKRAFLGVTPPSNDFWAYSFDKSVSFGQSDNQPILHMYGKFEARTEVAASQAKLDLGKLLLLLDNY